MAGVSVGEMILEKTSGVGPLHFAVSGHVEKSKLIVISTIKYCNRNPFF